MLLSDRMTRTCPGFRPWIRGHLKLNLILQSLEVSPAAALAFSPPTHPGEFCERRDAEVYNRIHPHHFRHTCLLLTSTLASEHNDERTRQKSTMSASSLVFWCKVGSTTPATRPASSRQRFESLAEIS